MPYRIDLPPIAGDALDRLIELGALDVDASADGRIAALMPDSVPPDQVTSTLGVETTAISPGVGRDAGSVWLLRPRPIQVGRVRIVPGHMDAEPGALRLIDGPAFGTGLHPTTALCLEILSEIVDGDRTGAVLDVGTGSGVLALAALTLGVPRALGIDIDTGATLVAEQNARLNGLDGRLDLAHGGPEAVTGTWPLVLANILAAPLMQIAPSLVRRVGHHGRLVLSGIPLSVADEVVRVYRNLGMHGLDTRSRAGWVALVLQASW